MNLIEYIDYFKENYISFDLNNNNMLMYINTEKNNVDISNSKNNICISVEPNSEDLELNPPITIRIYNNKHYRIFPTNTKLLVFVEDARIKINSIYNIEIS